MNLDVKNTNEDKNKIVDYILQKFSDKLYERQHIVYIITENGEVYDHNEYEDLLKENPGISKAYIAVVNLWFSTWIGYEPVLYYYPFIGESGLLLDIYLRKAYYYKNHFANLKYIAIITHFVDTGETIMEVGDLEIIEKNTNLTKLTQEILREEDKNPDENKDVVTLELDLDEQGRLWLTMKDVDEQDDENSIDWEKVEELERSFMNQKLFGQYDFQEAVEIINKYYNEKEESLADKVKIINNFYCSIFQSHRILISSGK